MPSGGVLVVGALAAMLYFGGLGVVHGVKKAAHAVGCMFKNGRTCLVKK